MLSFGAMRRFALILGLSIAGSFVALGVAHAIEWWHDPDRGCGLAENWQRTHRIRDLPGCDGELPRGAPPGEIAMRDAKKLLHDAERALDQGQATDIDAPLARAANLMSGAPNDPRVNWVRPRYVKAIQTLRARALLSPKLPALLAAQASAHKAADDAKQKPSPAARRAAMDAGTSCVDAFRAAEGEGVDVTLYVPFSDGSVRSLTTAREDCEAIAKTGVPAPPPSASASASASAPAPPSASVAPTASAPPSASAAPKPPASSAQKAPSPGF
jgi:hypothetical protein